MRLSELNGKRVCILGFGREGKSVFNAIEQYAPDAHVTVGDTNPDALNELVEKLKKEIPFKFKRGFDMQCGEKTWLRNIDTFDVIIKSPGIPPQKEFDAVVEKITNATQIFLDTVREKKSLVIGVTGSKGKSTVSSLIHAILAHAGREAYLVGNIGKPALDYLDAATADTIFVLEMSSYQLMDLTTSPHIAVITAFFPEHLNYHGSLEAYRDAKAHITRYQTADDAVFFDAHSEGAALIAAESKGKPLSFAEKDAPLSLKETHLLGDHNLRNIAAAWLVARELGIPKETAIEAIEEFRGLPHRLQSIGTHHGAEWIDDAISTTPESTIAALDALGDRVRIIILGGEDRGNDFTELGERIASSSIEHVILIGQSAPRIKQAIESAAADVTFHAASSMQETVQFAKTLILPPTPDSLPPIVLLSTASPSYDMFKNFEEKGNGFRQCIEA